MGTYDGGKTAIDISKWQGEWYPTSFAGLLDAVWIQTRDERGVLNPFLRQQMKAARSAGLEVGLYAWFRNDRPMDAFATELRVLSDEFGCEMLPFWDVERVYGSGHDFNAKVKAALLGLDAEMDAVCPIYCGAFIPADGGTRPWTLDLPGRPLLTARYPTVATPPADPFRWGEWADRLVSQGRGPAKPRGFDQIDLWQFSAIGNHAAATYGFSAGDLDLDVIPAASWQRLRRKKAVPVPPPVPPVSAPSWEDQLVLTLPTLRLGDEGIFVKRFQALCMANGADITVDGKFGPATEAAARFVQWAGKVKEDGVVGRQTWTITLGGKL